MRILITGSRDWDAYRIIQTALTRIDRDTNLHITMVSGACRTGADLICEEVAADLGWEIERHPARWYKDGVYNKRAGFIRNAEMVEEGADLCLAFIRNKSKGATMTAALAEEAGIETRVWRIDD